MSNTPQNVNVYKNLLVNSSVTILTGQTTSSIYDCIVSPDNNIPSKNHGTSSLRRITFPTGWTTCDVTFLVYNSLTDLSPTQLMLSDAQDITIYTLALTVEETTVSLVPYGFDSVGYFSVVCSVAQASDVDVGVILQPIYQGNA